MINKFKSSYNNYVLLTQFQSFPFYLIVALALEFGKSFSSNQYVMRNKLVLLFGINSIARCHFENWIFKILQTGTQIRFL